MKKVKHFLRLADLSKAELEHIWGRTHALKNEYKNGEKKAQLDTKTLVMIFEKSSTRTRLSFEAGFYQMGGNAVYLNTKDTQLGRGEPIGDAARVISRMCDLVMIRTFEQEMIESFAKNSQVPIINGLTNQHHPCQVLSDIFTYSEHRGSIEGKKVAWIGDANNVCNSWIDAAKLLGFNLTISSPPGFGPKLEDLDRNVSFVKQPELAARAADIVTTDVWTSMGFEKEKSERRSAFQNWQVSQETMDKAATNAVFMHCLPAHRGEEVTADVIDGPQSIVWDEAENRLHVQKALMEFLLLGHVKS